MISQAELFIIYLLLGLIAFIGIIALFSFGYFLRREKPIDLSMPDYKPRKRGIDNRPRTVIRSRGSSIKGNFREKLGEKVVKCMIEISSSGEKSVVRDRIQQVIVECDRLSNMNIPDENKKIISTVLLWAKNFDVDRHVSEIKIFEKSSQIVYNKRQRDFQLRLFGK